MNRTLTALAACALATSCAPEPCGEGYGRDDEGICRELLDPYAEADTDTDTDSDTDTDTDSDTDADTDTDGGTVIEISGTMAYPGEVSSGAICSVSLWDEADVQPGGTEPNREESELSSTVVSCPSGNGASATFSATLPAGSSNTVYLFGFIDPDGSADTFEDAVEAPADANPLTVSESPFTDVHIELVFE